MDNCRFYTIDDKATVNSWLEYHNMHIDEFPSIGYIVPGIAAGFLYKSEGSMGFLEHFITAPGNTKEVRQQALDEITNRLLEAAARVNIKKLFAITQNKGIEERCKTYGFTLVGSYLVYKKEI